MAALENRLDLISVIIPTYNEADNIVAPSLVGIRGSVVNKRTAESARPAEDSAR